MAKTKRSACNPFQKSLGLRNCFPPELCNAMRVKDADGINRIPGLMLLAYT